MNCPKCGHTQEERLDCLKCGIVFSKYSELHFAPEKAQRSEVPVPGARATAAHAPEDFTPGEVAELRQTVRELSRRFSELEFERADRNQIWKELRALEKSQATWRQYSSRLDDFEARLQATPERSIVEKSQAMLEKAQASWQQCSARLDDFEARLQAAPEASLELLKEQLWEEDLKPVLEKIAELEAGLEKYAQAYAAQSPNRAVEGIGKLESRVAELERGAASLASLREESAVALGKATAKCAELDASAQAALTLRNDVDELRKRLEEVKSALESQKHVNARLPELGNEILGLRSEVRQSCEQLAAVEARRTAQRTDVAGEDVSYLAARLDELADEVRSLADELQSTAALMNETRKQAGATDARLGGVSAAVGAIETETLQLRDKVCSLEQQLGSRQAPPQEERLALENDVHSIRDNLNQIRDFMNTLARKL